MENTVNIRRATGYELIQLFVTFYEGAMGQQYHDLIVPLMDSLPVYTKEDCLKNITPATNTLTRRTCLITSTFRPLPKTPKERATDRNELITRATKVSEGVYGLQKGRTMEFKNPPQYNNTFDVITKIPTGEFEINMIKEVFLQMVILNPLINELLQANSIDIALIPLTYGFFVCSQNIPNRHNPSYRDQCAVGVDGIPRIFVIQEYIPPPYITLNTYLGIHTYSIGDVFVLLSRMFNTLAACQKLTYSITHGDLHTGNVLINPTNGQLYLLDWGLASFTYNEKHYENFLEKEYRRYDDPIIKSGLYDLYFIMEMMYIAAVPPIKEQIKEKRRAIFSNIFPELTRADYYYYEGGIRHSLNDDLYLYRFLRYAEGRGWSNHAANIRRLNTYTYGYILNNIILVEIDKIKASLILPRAAVRWGGVGKIKRKYRTRRNKKQYK